MLELLLSSFYEYREFSKALEIISYCNKNNLTNISSLLIPHFLSIFQDSPLLLLELAKISPPSSSFLLCNKILSFTNIPQSLISETLTLQNNIIPEISNDFISYPKEIISGITSKKQNPFPNITFTITTCKRYDLFEKTINSFLNCCLDIHLIDHWICVDDNSSDQDRNKMKQNYPFFQFYFKNTTEKGHANSMNIIRNIISTPYTFHIEDDWKFFSKQNYISLCLNILSQSTEICQCLINKNYFELHSDNIVGGLPHVATNGQRYFIHEYCPDNLKFMEKYGSNKRNCAYWPHYSLRPSLLKSKIFKEIGTYNPSSPHFEMDYANRYVSKGYFSAFLENIYCLHIGRLTSERFDTSKLNAYDLNNEKQFSDHATSVSIKTVVINLDRRPDRWEKFVSQEEPKFLSYTKFSAVDGSRLIPTEQLQRIFDCNDYNMREGMVGCALSHIQIYIDFLSDPNNCICILEDDIEFVPNFKDKFIHLITCLFKDPDWDLCYLGHHLWPQYKKPEYYNREKMPVIEQWKTETSMKFSMGGTGGYIMSKKGVRNLLEFLNKNGLTNGIDTMQQKAADSLKIYYSKPHLIYSQCATPTTQVDTDIQYNNKSLRIPIEKRFPWFRKTLLEEYVDVIELTDKDNTIDLKNNFPVIYSGSVVKEIAKQCPLPYYQFEDKIISIIPQPTENFLKKYNCERLKKKGIFSLENVISYKD